MKRFTFTATLLLAAATVSACATTPVSRAPIASARAAVERAFESGASQDDLAVPFYRAAREELARSEQFANQEQGDRSRSMAMRAEADADLAMTMTRQSIAQRETQSATRAARRSEQREGGE